MQKEDCLFCRIARHEIAGHFIYEDDDCYATMDAFPLNPGHVLVIPREHYNNYLETPTDLLQHMIGVAQRIGQAQSEVFHCEGNRLIINCGEVGKQKIFHTHIHVVPYYKEEDIKKGSLEEQALKLKTRL